MKLQSITISGQLIGDIWMPCTECTKEFNRTFTPNKQPFTDEWTNLRDALLSITNDGDFRDAEIDYAFIDVTYRASDNKTVTISKELMPCKLVSDLFRLN